jgi:hypothetical protein
MDDSMDASAFDVDASSDFELAKPVSHSPSYCEGITCSLLLETQGTSKESRRSQTQSHETDNSAKDDESSAEDQKARQASI